MPDLRYHLISLISVFLALAVGVLLGVAMADGGVVTQGLRGQIEDVRERLDDQDREIVERNEEIATLTERAQEEQAVAERMSQVMISETLTNLNVTIVAGPFADADTTQSIQSAFDDAGSESISLTTLDEPDPAQVTGPEADPESLYIDEAVEILSEEGEGPPDIIVFVGGRDGAPDQEAYDTGLDTAETNIFETWIEAGIKVIAAEPSTAERTEIPLFLDIGIPSVDYADRPAGHAALVRLAVTESNGAYGTKDSASEIFPTDPG